MESERGLPAGETLAMPDCDRAHECQWQRQLGGKPCPPRWAYMTGRDPRLAGA
jgi:hypothetical protein